MISWTWNTLWPSLMYGSGGGAFRTVRARFYSMGYRPDMLLTGSIITLFVIVHTTIDSPHCDPTSWMDLLRAVVRAVSTTPLHSMGYHPGGFPFASNYYALTRLRDTISETCYYYCSCCADDVPRVVDGSQAIASGHNMVLISYGGRMNVGVNVYTKYVSYVSRGFPEAYFVCTKWC